MGTMTPPDAIWDSFGTSTPYGSFVIDGTPSAGPPMDGLMTTVPGIYTISLPGSIPDLTAAIMGGGIFIVTARLATFDPDPIGPGAPPAVDPYEYVFGITDVVSGIPTTPAPILTITTIPEPGTTVLALVAVLAFCARRRC